MLKFPFTPLALAVLLLCGLGAKGQIKGSVKGRENGREFPLAGADVFWLDSQLGTTTDSNGLFVIPVHPRSKRLVASMVGFGRNEKIIISRQGETHFVLRAEAEELEEVVVREKARSLQVERKKAGLSYRIDESELRKAACCNLSESFETNAAIDVAFADGITGTRQIELLGLAGRYVLLQRENIPYARGLNALAGLNYIPGPFIESMQVTKGLSSVVNGFESISGQINVEYYKPESAPRLLVNAFANAGSRVEGNLLYTAPGKGAWRNSSFAHYSRQALAFDQNDDGFADMPLSERFDLFNRSHYRGKTGWEGQWGFNLSGQDLRGGEMDFARAESPPDSLWGFTSRDRRYSFFGKTGYVFEKGEDRSLGFIYRASWQEKEALFDQRQYRGEQGSFYLNSIYQDYIAQDPRYRYRAGLSFQYDLITENLSPVAEYPQGHYGNEREEVVPGGFVEYTWEPGPRFTLVQGLRLDYQHFFHQWLLTPRLQLRYALSDLSTLRLSGGRGQRTPNPVAENYGVLASARIIEWPLALAPEVAWNGGLSLDQQLLVGQQVLNLTLDGFLTWFERKLITDLEGPRQADIYFGRGSEALSLMGQLDYSWQKEWELRMAYKYLRAEEAFRDGMALRYQIPTHRLLANLHYENAQGWKADLSWNWFGAKRQPPTEDYPREFQRPGFSPAYNLVHLQVNKVLGNWEFFVGSDNLLNVQQQDPILSAAQAQGPYFDANFNWGPIFGRMIYAGLYYQLSSSK